MPTPKRLSASLDDNRYEDALIQALRTHNGRATLGDVVASSGLPQGDAEIHLRRLTGLYKSHLEVDESGEILYVFDTSFERRDQDTSRTLYLLGQKLWSIFTVLFKVVIMLVLVLYAILYIALILATIFGGNDNDNDSGSGRSSSRGFGGLGWIFWSSGPRSSMGNVNNLRRGAQTGSAFDDSPNADLPFYKRVFAFVFGPEANDEDIEKRIEEKQLLAFIRSCKGVVSATDIMTHTGWSRVDTEERITRIMVDYDGQAHVTSEGTILYTFEPLLISALREPVVQPPPPIWKRLETRQYITGNSKGTNIAIVALNAINVVGSLIAPSILMPQLGIQPSLFTIFSLAAFPFIFSLVFFSIPAVRSFAVRKENRKRREENLWRIVFKELVQYARRDASFSSDELFGKVQTAWPKDPQSNSFYDPPTLLEVTSVLKRAAAEYEAEVDPTERGLSFRFNTIREEESAAERYRSMIDPDEFRLGKIVFSSAEDADDDGADQLSDFDRQLGESFSPTSQKKIKRENPELSDFDRQLQGISSTSADKDAQSALDDFDKQLQKATQAAVHATKSN